MYPSLTFHSQRGYLAKSLQATNLTASDGQAMAKTTVNHLKQMRASERYDKLYDKAIQLKEDLGKS